MIKIYTVYDNNSYHSSCTTDWGYACVIDHPLCKIIFDTGAKHSILENNFKELQIDPKLITHLVLSHKHWDHKGGVNWLLQNNPKMKVYMPKTFTTSLEKQVLNFTSDVFSIKSSIQINEKIHLILSKNLFINELLLVIQTSNGLIIITGCSHTGIENIVQKIQQTFNEKIHFIIGGFHLLRSSQKKIEEVSNFLKNQSQVDFIAPCHCTGDIALNKLRAIFHEKFKHNGVGASFLFHE